MKVPFYLVTGFLGSGKTTFLKQFLSQHSADKRIVVIENEFAQSGIDGEQLKDTQFKFSLVEMDKGSVFCVCLFSGFKESLLKILQENTPDLILLEATGIADPIAIALLFEDQHLKDKLYLAHIWDIIDAPRYLVMGQTVPCIQHQIEVADTLLVNKTDLVKEQQKQEIEVSIKRINPFTPIEFSTYCQTNTNEIVNAFMRPLPISERLHLKGELTRCGDGNYQSQIFKTTKSISEKKLYNFLQSLSDRIYRLKGYVQMDDGRCVMVQYVPNHFEVKETSDKKHPTELIAIGTESINFESYLS